VDVRKVDLAIELQILSFHEHRKAALTALPGAGASGLTALPGGLAATDAQEAVGT
jgi:redox-sensing transcriptional repressor